MDIQYFYTVHMLTKQIKNTGLLPIKAGENCVNVLIITGLYPYFTSLRLRTMYRVAQPICS